MLMKVKLICSGGGADPDGPTDQRVDVGVELGLVSGLGFGWVGAGQGALGPKGVLGPEVSTVFLT